MLLVAASMALVHHDFFELARELGDCQCRRTTGQGLHQQLSTHDGLAYRRVGRDVDQVDQPNTAAGFGNDKTIQHLLQLSGDRPTVAQAGRLVDHHVDKITLLLAGQHLDGRISVG